MLGLNQFSQVDVQGSLDAQSRGGTILSCTVSTNQSTPLIPGQAIMIDTAASSGEPKIVALSANTDEADGFVIFNMKDKNALTYGKAEVAMFGTIMYMTSNAAITHNRRVEVNVSDNTVGPAQGINPVIGWALDSASASGQLVRVFITTESSSKRITRVVTVPVTLAQLNAGVVLIPGTANKSLLVSNFSIQVNGTFSTLTSAVLESTNATPVVVGTEAAAGLVGGAVILPSDPNMVLGPGFGVALGVGDGLKLVHTGSAATGGTSLSITVTFTTV